MIHLFCERVEAIADAAGLRYWTSTAACPSTLWPSTVDAKPSSTAG